MSIKKIKKFNDQKFLDDLKRVRDVMVITNNSNAYLHVSKKELMMEAESCKIVYYISNKIFKVERDTMVIIQFKYEIMTKEEYIGNYIEKRMKNNKLPYGIEYLGKLDDIIEKAEKSWDKLNKQIIERLKQ